MPKGIDPKAYAARITKAKKTVAAMDPATRAKLKEFYPNLTREEVVKQALDTKKVNMKKSAAPKPATKKSAAKPAPLGTAPAAPRRGNAKPAPLGTPPAKPKGRMTPMPKTTKKAPGATKKPEKMTPQDAAMKKILEKKYGKIYG
jgi:hypothetical protein